MSVDKRTLDDLDALFRAVPAKAVSAARPTKKLRSVGTPGGPSSTGAKRARDDRISGAVSTNELHGDGMMYARLPSALLPKGLRAPPRRGGCGGTGSNNGNSNAAGRTAPAGSAAAIRLTDFVRGVLSATRSDRAATALMESRLEKKVVHLDNAVAGQTEAQRAGARAGRGAGSSSGKGLSGKKCKQMGLNALKGRDGGSIPFRSLLGLHELWKDYAARLVSQFGSDPKVLQQRILAADLQGCYLTVWRAAAPSLVNVAGIVLRETPKTFQLVTQEGKTKTIPKRSCAVRLAFGGRVVNLNGRALEGRRGGGRKSPAAAAVAVAGPDDPADFPLPTAAL
ncbi:unnamed protein product [Scytosiphon promiscuus]